FDGSHPLGKFLVSSGLPSMAWEASTRAHNSGKCFIVCEIQDVTFFAFSASEAVRDFLNVNSEFGEGNINTGNDLFRSLKINDGEPALVHQGLLHGFLNIIKSSDLVEKVEWSRRRKQGIVLTGHGLAGAMATLTTLWMLTNTITNTNKTRKNQNLPFCLTFGCPLLGDQLLAKTVRREKWCGQFCHVISKHDFLPRVLLAPFQLTHYPLNALLPYLYSSTQAHHDHFPLSNDQACSFLRNVLDHTQIAANCCTDNNGLVISTQSPYKPLGYYFFCSEKGGSCFETNTAVLQMLYFTLQDMELCSSSCEIFMDHIEYGKILEHNFRNLVSVGDLGRGYIDAENPYEVGIAVALEGAGVQIQ
ncbi:hypothetical protein KI387_035801, partial [Taxus chinensis]